MSNLNRCPQCGTGHGAFDWSEVTMMRCDICGYFVDITEVVPTNVVVDYFDMCPCCAIRAIKKDGLWKKKFSINGVGIVCTNGDIEFADDAGITVEDFDIAVTNKEIDPKLSYLTTANGSDVRFLRGSIETYLHIIKLGEKCY